MFSDIFGGTATNGEYIGDMKPRAFLWANRTIYMKQPGYWMDISARATKLH
jgi:hypothetical protein